MSDLLSNVTRNPAVRALIKSTGLPIPIPVELRRPLGPYIERPLDEWLILATGGGELGDIVAQTLIRSGARPAVINEADREALGAAGGVAVDDVTLLHDVEVLGGEKLYGLVFDASGINTPAGLRSLYDALHAWVPCLAASGRVVVLARPHDQAGSAATAAARRGIEGCVRSVAKEIGRFGSTANLIVVEPGAEPRVEHVLRFLLASSSAFVTAQPVRVSSRASFDGNASYVRPLEGKVALVTGAGRGIGEITARTLAAEGAHVVCLDRPEDGQLVRAVADRIGGSGLLVDVLSEEAPAEIAMALMAQHGGVDIVIHNAGITRDKTIARMSPEAWDSVVGVSLVAVDRITAALREGCLRDGGRIVCLSSVAGIAGNVGQTNYAAAKAGLIGLVQHLAGELAGRGITVNAVAPGFIETRMTEAIPFMVRETARRLSALGQGGRPEDVANAITFLSTPGAAGVTGGVLRVCGGALIGA